MNKYSNITSKQLKDLIDFNMTQDIKTSIKHNSKFFNKIYSNLRHSYQKDIRVNNFDDYLVIININTRFVVLESIPDKTTASILIDLKSMFKKLKLKPLELDEEVSFVSKPVLKYLDKKNLDYYVVTEQRHNNLSIIDRFIRTLSNWMRKNKSISDFKINKFIKTYNKTIHQSRGVSLSQMQDNKNLEVQYIIDSIQK
jgi:hypothetical protein